MTLRSTLVALAATLCTLPAWAGGFVNLPSTGTDIRVDGANNPAADPMFLADNPFASGYTLLGSLSQPLLFDLDDNGSLDWVGTLSDKVWRNNTTNKLTFALRLEDTRPFLSPLNEETEINLIWRSGFAGSSTAVAWYAEGEGGTDPDGYVFFDDFRLQAAAKVADGFVFRAGPQPGRQVDGSNYNANTVGFRTDTSVGESNPNSGWYLVQTNADSFTLRADLVHVRQSAGTGPEARPQRDWVIAGFAPLTPVPEPGSAALLLAGAATMAWRLRQRRGYR
jgi:PEP-CTERM motif